jgi:putative transposase
MKGKIHSPEQVLKLISLGDQMLDERKSVAEAARHSGLKEATWYRWKDTYGGMKGPEMKKLKELQAENVV